MNIFGEKRNRSLGSFGFRKMSCSKDISERCLRVRPPGRVRNGRRMKKGEREDGYSEVGAKERKSREKEVF